MLCLCFGITKWNSLSVLWKRKHKTAILHEVLDNQLLFWSLRELRVRDILDLPELSEFRYRHMVDCSFWNSSMSNVGSSCRDPSKFREHSCRGVWLTNPPTRKDDFRECFSSKQIDPARLSIVWICEWETLEMTPSGIVRDGFDRKVRSDCREG